MAATAYQLAQQFITMIRERIAEVLDTWLEASISSEIIDLQNFVQRGTPLAFSRITAPYAQL